MRWSLNGLKVPKPNTSEEHILNWLLGMHPINSLDGAIQPYSVANC